MKGIFDNIRFTGYFQALCSIAGELGSTMYLTGGGVRDTLLRRKVRDLDFALSDNPERLPRRFAQRMGGTFFWLDRERLQSRVVTRNGPDSLLFDFAPLRGATIVEDLALRDFTVNAMAMEVAGNGLLIDPLHGAADLRNGIIRRCSPNCFSDDPLRLIRAVRHAAVLGFTIEIATRHDIKGKALLLEGIAAERIRDEFMQILDVAGSGASLTLLHDLGLLRILVPASLKAAFDEMGVEKGIRAVVELEEAVAKVRLAGTVSVAVEELDSQVEGGVRLLALVKLAAFIGRDASQWKAWAKRLRLGRKGTRVLAILAGSDSVPLARMEAEPEDRVLFRFFRDYTPAGLELALLALARGDIAAGLWGRIANYYVERYDRDEPDLLLSGQEIMDLLGIRSGPAVGAAMARLRNAEAQGQVRVREEARLFLLKNQLTKEGPMR